MPSRRPFRAPGCSPARAHGSGLQASRPFIERPKASFPLLGGVWPQPGPAAGAGKAPVPRGLKGGSGSLPTDARLVRRKIRIGPEQRRVAGIIRINVDLHYRLH
eukprot:9552125-Lingulodinium_polyedra.AAC.2